MFPPHTLLYLTTGTQTRQTALEYMDGYGIMALQNETGPEPDENGCVGCQRIQEEELSKKLAVKNAVQTRMSMSSATSLQSKSLLVPFPFPHFYF